MDISSWEPTVSHVAPGAVYTGNPYSPFDVSGCPGLGLSNMPFRHGTPAQLATPPDSVVAESPSTDQSYDLPEESTIVSMSTSFGPTTNLLPTPPDLILVSSDSVFFYVHATQLLSLSSNHFNGLLPPTGTKMRSPPAPGTSPDADPDLDVVPVRECSAVLNILLHAVYDISCAHYSPTIDTLISAVDAMPTYGLSPQAHIAPSTPLFSLLLARAPIQPIAVYALAGAHELPALAAPVSAHLLAFPLHTLSDVLALRMGPLYLKRLFFLHLGRIQALRRLLVAPPHPHPPSEECDFPEQKRLARAWALASAYLAWDAQPGHSVRAIENALCPLADYISCLECKQALADRVKQVVVQWSMVRTTII